MAEKPKDRKRQPPIRILLSFDQAVSDLLAVDPNGPVPEKAVKKKARRKK